MWCLYVQEMALCVKQKPSKLSFDMNASLEGPLGRWLNVNVSECGCAWIHVEALRVFGESVLRVVNLYIVSIVHLCQLSLFCISCGIEQAENYFNDANEDSESTDNLAYSKKLR
jgi:hypothetical protein